MANIIKIAIIEDEPAVRKEISFLIGLEKDAELLGWADSVRTAQNLIAELQPDVVLLDIQLRDGTAFDLLKKLHPIPPNIIFITAYNHFAIKAIKYGALDYLLKPVDQTELKEALERFRRRRQSNPQWMQQLSLTQDSMTMGELPESIVLNTLNNMRIVPVKDIVYCKGDGPYTYFFFSDGTEELISKPLKYYEDLLPAPHFLRTHQSYLVNKQHITGVNRSEYIVLNTKEEIPISMRRRNAILTLLSSKK